MIKHKNRVFSQITNDEIPVWVSVLSQEIDNPGEILKDMKLIDDLLVLQKTQCLLMRKNKRRLHEMMQARIGHDLDHPSFPNQRLLPDDDKK